MSYFGDIIWYRMSHVQICVIIETNMDIEYLHAWIRVGYLQNVTCSCSLIYISIRDQIVLLNDVR